MTEYSDEYWMQLAYEQAELAAQQGGDPCWSGSGEPKSSNWIWL